jgi:hypothetical protein
MRSCHTKNTNSSQEIHHQHEKQENQIICLGHCCQNCQCDDVMTAVLINNLDINGDVQIHHIEYKIDFMVFVPFQETQPLLRPPIV